MTQPVETYIVGARRNLLQIHCGCGHHYWSRAERWLAKCPACGAGYALRVLRERRVKGQVGA